MKCVFLSRKVRETSFFVPRFRTRSSYIIDMPEFVSVENVRISLLPATLFQRFAAIAIDIIFTLIFLGISALVGSSFIRSGDEWMIVLYCLFFFFLPVLEEITFNGRTIGKLCLRLRVVQIDGSAPTVWTLLLRYFLLWIDVFGSFGSGLLLIFGTKLHRRWGDLAAGTFVAQSGSNYGNRSPLHAFDDLPNYERTFSRIDRIDARRAALISRALGAVAMHSKTFDAGNFARRVEAVVGGRLPEETDVHYLSAVLYAYRHAA